MNKFGQLEDQEIADICRNICGNSDTEGEAMDKIKERFNIELISVCFSQPNAVGQKMVMGMIFGPRGNTISF